MEHQLNPQTLGDIPEEYIEHEDGSVEIPELEPVVERDSSFRENLADVVDNHVLNNIASDLCFSIELDRESRKKRDEQYEEGLRRTGLGNDAPGGADFDGASRVVHPVLVEACIDFQSRAIKELFPSAGPVKSQIIGEHDPKKTDRANRKTRFMNWQLTTQIQEYRSELEQLLTQLPMGGSQFQKFWYDPDMGRVRCEFVPVDEIFLPYAATNFYTAERATQALLLTRESFRRRVNSGLYRDVFMGSEEIDGSMPELSDAATANDKIEGREEDGYNQDGLRIVYEVYTWLRLEEDDVSKGELAPYILSIDKDTERVLSVYRNWEEGDTLFRKLEWFVEWKFVPWRGAYAIGLPHIIGGMSGALTGALRALLDSAHINNAASMLKLKSGKTSGANKQVNITEVTEIEAPAGTDDIRKIAMPMPFNPPSPVLLQLMDKLYGLSKSVVAAADDRLDQVGDRTPVGTTMALIEQGSAVYSAIHARLHESQKKALEILHRLNEEFLDEERVEQELGERLITKEDFTGSMDVIPVSDPTIFSEAQRFAQTQAVVQMSQDPSVPWNKINIYRRALKQMRVENVDEILPAPKDPITADTFTENYTILQGTPIRATKDQDHMAHILGHMAWVSSPIQINNPLVPPQALMQMLGHVGEHIQMLQEATVQMLMQANIGLGYERAAVQAQTLANPQLQKMLAPIMQQIQTLQQQLQQRMPQGQMPPEVQASIQIAQMDTQRKQAYDQAQIQIQQQRMQIETQSDQQKLQLQQTLESAQLQLSQQSAMFDQQIKTAELSLQRELETLRQQVELLKNERDNAQKQETELLKNEDDNRTRIAVEHIRIDAKPSGEQ